MTRGGYRPGKGGVFGGGWARRHALAEHRGALLIVVLGRGAASEMDAPAARGLPRGGRNFRMTGVRHSHPDRADGPARLTLILPRRVWAGWTKLLTSEKEE